MLKPQQLPHDMDLEREVLGAVFVQADVLYLIREHLAPSDFWNDAHRLVYQAMIDLQEKHGTCDFPLLNAELKARNQSHLAQTLGALMDRAGTTYNVPRYATRLAEYSTLRRVAQTAEAIALDACQTEAAEDPMGWTADSLKKMEDAAESAAGDTLQLASDAMPSGWFDVHENRENPAAAGLLTDFNELNEWAGGGPRKLVLVPGRAAMGKTCLVQSLTRTWAKRKLQGCWIQQEMVGRDFWGRFHAMASGVPFKALMGREPISKEQLLRASHAANTISDWPIAADFTPRQTPEQIKLTLLKARRRLKGLHWAVVDHFHCMRWSGTREQKRSQMEDASGYFRDLAKELNICLIVLVQLNRDPVKREDKRPIMEDMRECGALEQDAEIILSPFRPWVYDKHCSAREAELGLLKNRNGRTGWFPCTFLPQLMEYRPKV